MEKKMMQAITYGDGRAANGQQQQQQQKDVGKCSAFPIVQILGTIVEQATASAAATAAAAAASSTTEAAAPTTAAPSLVGVSNINQAVLEPYCPVLLKLATRLTRDHTSAAMMIARPGMAQLQFMATPTMAILDEALSTAAATAAAAAAAAAASAAGGSGSTKRRLGPRD
eukprot:evm.model.NODE_35146_length_38824_cov_40.990341.6